MATLCVISESDPFIARLLKRFAVESGMETVLAGLGQGLMQLVEDTRPSVLILDIELPGLLRGWQVVQKLRGDPQTARLPIIVCSWLEEAEVQRLVGGDVGYLQKPDLSYSDFLDALRKAGVVVSLAQDIGDEETQAAGSEFD